MSRQSAIDAAQCPWRVAGPITNVGTPVPVKCT
ncbi:aminopeptidase ypdE domain protein, partial [Shigella flexneri 1235-66]